ncbi:hypothetical protein VNI00_003906 [Paramarasmius palmivorus]|uniref:RING-type domain-containing protein n=1 Tax=Paramarasmius palmivorus TaxID=297713 RepID=A0AAW0DPC2_9AGAR
MRGFQPAVLSLLACLSSLNVLAYVPASPTNNTADAIAAGLNVSDVSMLHLQWFSNGSYAQNVSYQLAGNGSEGVSQGVLVHFSEVEVNNKTDGTETPWIALVSCDFNATDADQEIDIFTLARDKGAKSALLYSRYSSACVINPYYADPSSFDQVFDIFSTQSLTSARLIDYQFGQITSPGQNYLDTYNSTRLNTSASTVIRSINEGYAVAPGYLFATLVAHNATNASSYNNNGNTNSAGNPSSSQGRSTTALAMIVLYAITGCVSALFCVVIITGAIRAIRHPERYGPRARYGAEAGMIQSRARGLTRAILDTFPVVKFGSQPNSAGPKDVERSSEDTRTNNATTVQMSVLNNEPLSSARHQERPMPQGAIVASDSTTPEPGVNDSDDVVPVRPRNHVRTSREDVTPAAIGRETCPICIVDFEEGDDIRILPCEGQHRFHQQCVDPWLLELSSSCPLCRHDFLALENMLNGDSEEGEIMPPPANASESAQRRSGRFSRYVRSAIHRHRHRRGDHGSENTPPVPPVPQPPL